MKLGEIEDVPGADDIVMERVIFGFPTLAVGGSMEQVNAYCVYELGEFLGRLATRIDTESRAPVLRVLFALVAAGLRKIDETFAPLPESRNARLKLLDSIQQLTKDEKTTGAMPSFRRRAIVRQMHAVSDALNSEFRGAPVFYVPKRLGYDTDVLLTEAECVLPAVAAKMLPANALRDLQEATRSFAFGLWTAVAYHMLRATEIVMVELIRRLGGTVPEEGSRNWSNLIKALGNTRKAKPRTVGRLTRLKDLERNELMHAGRFLDEAECSDVFDYAKNAMVPMLLHLAELNDVSGEPTS